MVELVKGSNSRLIAGEQSMVSFLKRMLIRILRRTAITRSRS
jgi:hypothetical protein